MRMTTPLRLTTITQSIGGTAGPGSDNDVRPGRRLITMTRGASRQRRDFYTTDVYDSAENLTTISTFGSRGISSHRWHRQRPSTRQPYNADGQDTGTG